MLGDKKALLGLPNLFQHLDKVLDEEINRVRSNLFNLSTTRYSLPDAIGKVFTLTEKLVVPSSLYPDFNFVGRILGPRGMTAKQLELDTGCKILVRGKGSMREKAKEEIYRDKPNWEHLKEDLHVLITVDDSENRAKLKLARAVGDVKKLLVPPVDGEDNLKKLQLMELAIINGTYRENSVPVITSQQGSRIIATPIPVSHQVFNGSSLAAGAPIILAPRVPNSPFQMHHSPANNQVFQNPQQATIISSPHETNTNIFYQYSPLVQPTFLDYSPTFESANVNHNKMLRRALSIREHPYSRTGHL